MKAISCYPHAKVFMRILTRFSAISIAAAAFLTAAPPRVPLYQQFMSPDSPQELVAARKVDRIAWVDYAEGKRNAYTAAAPNFTPVRLTNFMKDDGIMMRLFWSRRTRPRARSSALPILSHQFSPTPLPPPSSGLSVGLK